MSTPGGLHLYVFIGLHIYINILYIYILCIYILILFTEAIMSRVVYLPWPGSGKDSGLSVPDRGRFEAYSRILCYITTLE